MSKKAQVTGTIALVDESTNANVLSYDLSNVFSAITGLKEHIAVERELIDGDGVVSLDLGGIGTIKGLWLWISSGTGTVTLKHDSNTNGMTIDNGIVLFGSLGSPTIETTATQALVVKYVLFE